MAGRNRHASLPISYLVQSTSPVILYTTKYYSVLQSTTPVLQSTTPYYKALLQYYSSTTKYCSSTKYYKSTTPSYKVVLQYCSALLCTTKYYKILFISITLYIGSATKYYSVLESLTWNVIDIARSNRCRPPTSPNTVPATKSHCHDWSSSRMKRYLQRAEQQKSSSNITKYCACHEKSLSWLILVTYDTSDGILPLHPLLCEAII